MHACMYVSLCVCVCVCVYERRSGNRWYKAKNDREPEIRINDEKIQVYKRHESFTYLGKSLTVTAKEERHVPYIIKSYSDLLDQILACFPPLALKLEAKKTYHFQKSNIILPILHSWKISFKK